MEISYLGHSSFKIASKKATIVTDPFSSSIGFSLPKTVKAEIVTVSHPHQDHNFVQGIKGEPFVITAPGEYEVSGVDILGLSTFHDQAEGGERGRNTIYQITTEDLCLLHCGDLGHLLSHQTLDELNQIDIIMVPVGGVYTIDHKGAEKVVNAVEAKIVLPMHYQTKDHDPKTFGELRGVRDFLEEMEVEGEETTALRLTRSDLPEETKVVVLTRK